MFYEDWYRFDPSRVQRSRHLRSFLLTFAAELALYEKATRVVTLLTRNRNVIEFLDGPHPERDLGENSLSSFRQELQGTRDGARVLAGKRYLRWLEQGMGGRAEAWAAGYAWLWDRIERHLAIIEGPRPCRGQPYRVIEAISEGVVFSTLDHAAGDYLVALRPRLSKKAKAQAIVEAFAYLGRPYDLEFDFATDHALVCTELIWRAYRPSAGKDGLDLALRRAC